MSNVPAKASTRPAGSSCEKPASAAATKVSAMPTVVIWFGVRGERASKRASRSALRLTHAWKRVVNTLLRLLLTVRLSRGATDLPRLLIDLDDLGRHHAPGVSLRLGQRRLAQPPAQSGVAGEDRQGHPQ